MYLGLVLEVVLGLQKEADMPHQRHAHSVTDLFLSPGPEVTLQPARRTLDDARQHPCPLRANASPSSKSHRSE